ncbi:hypothetical protein K458DRAFT_102487 [Lentithecium fluviatile CBS 122367]|uniref:Uncharacterized protein n=1 Tax=Lentithecium fluviatile CBS 122367 TaxID=1168545 RepID=A0A6G1JIL2_9PLEO|nr:hypothetical protein K458DRAFT_102487 [Lentithecium fluviatile CBS 122367]
MGPTHSTEGAEPNIGAPELRQCAKDTQSLAQKGISEKGAAKGIGESEAGDGHGRTALAHAGGPMPQAASFALQPEPLLARSERASIPQDTMESSQWRSRKSRESSAEREKRPRKACLCELKIGSARARRTERYSAHSGVNWQERADKAVAVVRRRRARGKCLKGGSGRG